MHRSGVPEPQTTAATAADPRPAAAGLWSRLFSPPALRRPLRYAAALVLAAAAVATTLMAGDLLQSTVFLVPLGAVAVSGWMGGLGPALTACLTSGILTWFFVFEPGLQFQVADPGDAVRTGLFFLVGSLIGALTESLRSSAAAAALATAEAGRSAAEAREQRMQTELVLRSVSDGITVQSADGRLIYANDAAARLTGFASGPDLLTAPTAGILDRFEILDEDGAPVPRESLPGRIALRDRVEIERLLRYRVRGSGEERWSLVRSSPALDESGAVRFAVNVFHDLTERIEYERELESANRAKSQFLAVMSHELRTPLNAIMGYQELLEHEIVGPVTDRQREQLGRIGQSARHLLDLIEQVLTLSRIDAGREEIRREPVALQKEVARVASLMEPLARKKGVDLEIHIDGSAPRVVDTDPVRLRQILLNVLSNAVKFTEEGGVRVEIGGADGHATIAVRDTGPGIPPEDRERIFEPFVQGPSGDDGRAPGTGLGLTVARQLAGLLGGSLELESQPGAGSAFTLRIPT